MRCVPVKGIEEQAAIMVVKHRQMLVAQRTQTINSLRGHALEFRVIAPKGEQNVGMLLATLGEETTIPAVARPMFAEIGQHIADLDGKIGSLDRQLLEQHRANPVSQLLVAVE
jgi:transposase